MLPKLLILLCGPMLTAARSGVNGTGVLTRVQMAGSAHGAGWLSAQSGVSARTFAKRALPLR